MPAPPFQAAHPRTSLVRSVQHAWNGLIYTVMHQRNMRIHIVSGLLVGLVGSGIPLDLSEKVILIFCVLLVFFAEMLNSALEQLVDLAIQQFDEKAKLTKDIAAAGVLVLAIGTVVIFAAIAVHNTQNILNNFPAIGRQVAIGIPLAALAAALIDPRRKPLWLEISLSLAALALWALLSSWTESLVFSAMTLGLLIVCVATAREARKNKAQHDGRAS